MMSQENHNLFSLSRNDTSILKGIAICAMLFHHVYASLIPDDIEPYGGVLKWIGVLGKVCVAIFLFCSGYGMSVQFRKVNSFPDTILFLRRRFIKFYTNFWVVYFIFVPITVLFFNRPLSAAYPYHAESYKCVADVVLDLLCVPGRNPYNITWWFNQLIVILYFLFPLMNWLVRKAGIIISFIIGFLVFRFHYQIPGGICEVYLWQFPFLLGILWAVSEKRIPARASILLNSKWSLFAVIMLLAVLVFSRMRDSYFWFGVHIDPFIAVTLAVIVLLARKKEDSYWGRALSFLGKHSINIYLVHTFINGYWRPEWLHTADWMRCGLNFVILMSICLVISMILEFLKRHLGIYSLSNKIIG